MNAVLVFGDVAVPVKLHSATTSKDVRFKEVHLADGAKIEHRRFCSAEDKEVPYEEVAMGYEIADGKYAVLTKDQLAAAMPHSEKTIAVEEFVPADEIDPLFYDRGYYVGPAPDGEAGYRLLHDALARTSRAGIAHFVFRDRERLAALRPHDGILLLHTLRFADELARLDELAPDDAGRAPTPKEIKMAEQLVETLHVDFDPGDYRDEHRAAVMKLIEAKAAGEEIQVPQVQEPEVADDLAAALQASLEAREHSGRRRRGTAPKRKPAKRRG
jgi:DNA end-binding protein Ku